MTVVTGHEAGLHDLLGSLASYAVPARLAEVRTVLRVELTERRRRPVVATARIADGRVEVLAGSTTPDPDVVLRSSPDVFAGIVRGELNAGLEHLRGTLDIDGDADHALAVGGMIRLMGTRDTPVDPRALDPVAVAVALGEVRGDHLKKVMRSGFRPVVLGEIFRRLPDFVNARKAATVHLVVGLRLTGNPSGEVERHVVTVDHGTARVEPVPGEAGDPGERHATITCEGHDFLKLATGHLNPVLGVLRGQLKVRGDQARALQLSSVLDIPQPA